MFTITGITGQVGGALAEWLLAEGCAVRAVARNAERARGWTERGCSLMLADMEDADALTTAFADSEGVFVLIPPMFDPSPDFAEAGRVIAAVRTALDHARPDRVVVLSTVGAQATRPNLLAQLGLMEREIGTLGLPIAFLRAAWFIENARWDVEAARAGAIRSFLQPLDRAIPMVATADIAVAAGGLLRQAWHGRRVVELQGPTTVSPDDIATTFQDLLGHPVIVEAVPQRDWEAIFRAQGMSNPIPRMQMLDGFNEGWISFEGSAAETVIGTKTLRDVLGAMIAHG